MSLLQARENLSGTTLHFAIIVCLTCMLIVNCLHLINHIWLEVCIEKEFNTDIFQQYRLHLSVFTTDQYELNTEHIQ